MTTAADASQQPRPIPLAIVGMGCLFPKADSPEAFWANIRTGVDAVTEIPESHWRPEDYFAADPSAPDMTYARRGAFIEPVDFNPLEFGITPNNIEATDTTQLLGMWVAQQALRGAGYATGKEGTDGRAFNRERTSVILGVTGALELVIPLGARLGHPIWRKALKEAGVEQGVAEDVVRRIADSYVPWQENSFPGLLGNVAAGRIANRFDLGGTNCVVDAACASSLGALHMAAMELYAGRSDMAITGGIDTFNDIFMFMCFSKTPALSPTGNSRPFSAGGDGTILGEGLGVVVLKRLEDAQRDGDRIIAVIKSIGSSSDGKGNAVYAPSADGQVRCLMSAYGQAGVSPRTIELVEAHGTGTKVGDAVEAKALAEVYRTDQGEGTWCALGSVKSMVGHTKAAAGIAGLIKAAMALEHKVLPPTIKVEQPLESIEPGKAPVYVNAQARPWMKRAEHPRRAAVSAFGFGGSNFHCVLEEGQGQRMGIDWDDRVLMLAISGQSVGEIAGKLKAVDGGMEWKKLRAESRRMRAAFEGAANCRLVLVAEKDRTDLGKLIGGALRMLEGHAERKSWSTPDGAYFGSGPAGGKLGLIFPGQGSQYTGMMRDLACQFPQMLEALEQADGAFGETEHGQRLSDRIYPISKFTDEARAADELGLANTRIAQPALGAVSLGAWRVLEHFGVKAGAAAGHSFGELVALSAGGRIDSAGLHALACVRGRAMAGIDGGGIEGGGVDRGSMLAVAGPVAEVARVIDEQGLDLVIANKNGPEQVVLSGGTAEIERAEEALQGRYRCRRLAVSAAFHSEFVREAQGPFAKALKRIAIGEGAIPVYSNTTGEKYPEGAEAAREMLARQIVEPVEFVVEIQKMYESGVRMFVEVGPGGKMAGLVRAILAGKACEVMAVDGSAGKRPGVYDLACVLAHVAAGGHEVSLERWDEATGREAAGREAAVETVGKKPAMTIRLGGANYVKPRVERKGEVSKAKATAMAAVAVDRAKTPTAATMAAVETNAAQASAAIASGRVEESKSEGSVRLSSTPNQSNRAASTGPQTQAVHAAAHAPVSAPQAAQVTQGPAGNVGVALQVAQQSLLALQKMQEQTAHLHQQYLQGQEIAQRTMHQLVEQQMRLLGAACGVGMGAGMELPAMMPMAHVAAMAPIAPMSVGAVGSHQVFEAAETAATEESFAGGTPAPQGQNSGGTPAPQRGVAVAAHAGNGHGNGNGNGHGHGNGNGNGHAAQLMMDGVMPSAVARATATAIVAARDEAGMEKASAILLEVVADKTGYPVEMLELDMSLDSDLGIDSIKRVEILSALQIKLPDAPVVRPEDLGRLGTLRAIVAFLGEGESKKLEVRSEKREGQLSVVSSPLSSHSTTDNGQRTTDNDLFATRNSQLSAPRIESVLLEVVADKTGYPVEMLELDMCLDSDLGIDSIKRVEILSALQLKLPEAPIVRPEDLGRLGTLRAIVGFLGGAVAKDEGGRMKDEGAEEKLEIRSEKREGQLSVVSSPLSSHSTTDNGQRTTDSEPGTLATHNSTSDSLERHVLTVVPLDHRAARAKLKLAKGAAIWVTDDGAGLAGKVCKALKGKKLDARVVDLGAAIGDEALAGLLILAPANPNEDFIRRAFQMIRSAGPALRKSAGAGGAFLVSASRLDGAFALNGHAPGSALTGGLAGLVKTASHEWAGVSCKSLDLTGEAMEAEAIAGQIAEEVLVEGPAEVGLSATGRCQTRLVVAPLNGEVGDAVLQAGDVVVVTGGARGVTATVSIALAHAHRCSLLLLGRSDEPKAEPEWLAGITGEARMKKAIIAQAGKLSPKELEERYRRAVINREMLATIREIESAGARVWYRSLDVRDGAAVEKAVAEIRSIAGPIRGIIHGAGVLQDRLIEEKTDAQFDEVYSTKVEGFDSLLRAVGNDPLKAIVAFSSSTGRFGRKGQVAYAAANEVLNKLAQAEARRRPGCRVLSINWGPWEGGMVTPQLRRIFENEGVGLIPMQAGAAYLLRELATPPGGPVEIVILGPGGAGDGSSSKDSADRAATPGEAPVDVKPAVWSKPDSSLSVAFERDVNLDALPMLRSHVIKGRAVVPMAIVMEWLAHGAIHENPGMAFHGVDDLRIFKGLVLERDGSMRMRVLAGHAVWRDGMQHVPVELRSGQTLHARAEIVLTERLPVEQASAAPAATRAYPAINGEIYRDGRLFHGIDLHGIEAVEGWSEGGIVGRVSSAPAPGMWMKEPMRSAWLADPLAIDASFQLMILWCFEARGVGSLPTRFARYRQFRSNFGREGLRVVIADVKATAHSASAVIEFIDPAGALIARIDGYECVMDETLGDSFKHNQLQEEPAR